MYRTFFAVVGVAAASASAAPAAEAPPNSTAELKSRAPAIAADYARAILEERGRAASDLARSSADARPWDDPAAACRTPAFQQQAEVGRFMARHIVAPVGTTVGAGPLSARSSNDALRRKLAGHAARPARRRADGTAAALRTMNAELRRNVAQLADTLPAPGEAVFLARGETLKAEPTTWNQALRQRAEWDLALDAVGERVRAAARVDPDFGTNYAAALWTAMACDFEARHARFLAAYEAADQSPDDASRKAYDFLKRASEAPAS